MDAKKLSLFRLSLCISGYVLYKQSVVFRKSAGEAIPEKLKTPTTRDKKLKEVF